jgi:hypothetical protein
VHLEDILRISTLMPVVSFFSLKKRNDKVLRAIFFFNIFYIVFEVVFYSIRLYDKNISNYFNLFFVPLEYFAITQIFKFTYKFEFSVGFLRYSFISLVLFWIISTFFTPVNTFNSALNGFESLLVIMLSLLFFYEEIKKPQTLFIYSLPQFWGIIGLFLFFSGSFFVFLYKETHRFQEQFKDQYLFIHSGFFILRSVLFSIAMFVKPEQVNLPKERSSYT